MSLDDEGTPDEDEGEEEEEEEPGVEWSLEQGRRLLGRLIKGMQLYEQDKEAELLQVRLDYHKATGTPLPSVHSTPRSPSASKGQAAAAPMATPAHAAAASTGLLAVGSRVSALSMALRASQDEVARLRSHMQDIDALRRAAARGQPDQGALMDRALTLTLDLPFEHWCHEAEDKVVEEVAMVAGVDMDQVSILAVSPGSVVLKILIDATDLAVCVKRLHQDVYGAHGHLLQSIGAIHLEPPPVLAEGYLPQPHTQPAAGEEGAAPAAGAWVSGLRELLSGLASSTAGLALAPPAGTATGAGRGAAGAGVHSDKALEEAVLRAERAEARALTAEKHLLELGTPKEVLAVLQRKCSEAEVEASRAGRQVASLNKQLKKMQGEQAGLQDALEALRKAREERAADERHAGAAGQLGRGVVGGGGGGGEVESSGSGGKVVHDVAELEAALAESERGRNKLRDELRDVKAVLSQARHAAKEASSRLEAEQSQGRQAHASKEEGEVGDVRALKAQLRQAQEALETARQDSSSKGEALGELEVECEGLREHLRVELERASQVITDLQGERSEASAAQESAMSQLRADFEQMVHASKTANSKIAELSQALVSSRRLARALAACGEELGGD